MKKIDALESIIQLIRNCTLSPGQRISVDTTSNILNLSQTPIREALSSLSKDGIVLHRPGQGFFIPCYTEDELENLYDFLYVLLAASLHRIMTNLERSEIDTSILPANLLKKVGDISTWNDRDQAAFCMEEIFTYVSKLSGNKFIADAMFSCVIKTSFSRKIEYHEKMRRLSVKKDVVAILNYIFERKKTNINKRIISSQKHKSKIIRDVYHEYSAEICKNIYSNQ